MTSSIGDIFRVTGHLCGEFTGPRWIPAQRPVTRSFDVFFDMRLNTRLRKQSWGWWFETLLCPLWRHCNANTAAWLVIITHVDQSETMLENCDLPIAISTAKLVGAAQISIHYGDPIETGASHYSKWSLNNVLTSKCNLGKLHVAIIADVTFNCWV